ncbi:hypothetical protein E3W66_05055 [Gammaproteobacteria bacterium LSUCC0057]|uniref:ATP-grasp domain-containing protein n=1 Tax=Gammaproteobacteria bacterium LSUCC0057 TaxID=2559237 RepID=A0A4Y8UKI0_9GAMM|nr:hypothetical protein E3W66_05055 [Gammaproteobacteria bacterium LSUCC0057]
MDPNSSVKFSARYVSGYWYGLRYPSIIVDVAEISLSESLQRYLVDQHLTRLMVSRNTLPAPHASLELPSLLVWMCDTLHRAMDAAIVDSGFIVPGQSSRARCVIPVQSLSVRRITTALNHYYGIVVETLHSEVGPIAGAGERLNKRKLSLEKFLDEACKPLFLGSNTAHFLRNAHYLGIPYQYLYKDLVQYGYSSKRSLLQSSFTPQTNVIAVQLSRDKIATQHILKSVGIPTAAGVRVKSEQQAVEVAATICGPTVIKPVDKDGGLAVSTHLYEAADVAAAYKAARRYSSDVMLERHFDGRDYRIVIYRDAFLWAIERKPASILGDGVHTVVDLVAMANSAKQRSRDKSSALVELELDDEALRLLTQQSLSVDAVLPAGQRARLRGKANIGAGGVPVTVPKADIHPDNIELCSRVCQALGLDLAGVDLIIPDISISWLHGGCIVVEVNAQPQLGQITSAHLYGEILRREVDGNGRVPITLIVGRGSENYWASLACRDDYASVGVVRDNRVLVGGKHQSPSPEGVFAGGMALLRDRRITSIILEVTNLKALALTGLPCDQVDTLILPSTLIELDLNDRDGQALVEALLPQVASEVVCGDEKLLPTIEIWLAAAPGRRLLVPE